MESFRPEYAIYDSDGSNSRGDERGSLEKVLTFKLREVMLNQDLEETTCKQLRLLLEEEMKMDLKEYRGFLDQQMLRILGQMERPSQIFDYLYLGSEWNASNLQELKELRVKYILNISREIDNFYPEEFKYLNIRLYDLPNSELMKHWDKTYTFLKEAKSSGKGVLVHCKMGISRSAATVMAFAMKEYKMSLADALSHVKSKRSIANPNEGFLSQLQAYEGILKARHNELWGKMAPSRPLSLYRARSHSEPNIPELFSNTMAREEAEPELSFLDEDANVDTSPLLHASSSHIDHENKRPNFPFHLQPRNLSRFPPHAIDKNENIRNFLASLPNISVEDDPGLGENVCTSESGSGFSSPISSPTDEEHLPSRYNKLAQEIRREHKSTSEPQKVVERAGERGGDEEAGRKDLRDMEQEGEDLERRADEEEEEGGKERKRGAEEEEETDGTTQIKRSKEDGVQIVPSGTISSLPEDTHDEEGVSTVLTERSQPVAGIPVFQGIPKPLKSTSLPRNIVSQHDPYFQEYIKPPFPPTSEIEDESMVAEQGSTNISEIRSESVYEPSLSPSEQSNREPSSQQKSQDTSGPVELPQIYSVPERIKEIEEMNSLKGSSKSPTVPPSDGLSSEKKCVGGEDFGVADNKDTEMISLKGSSKSPTVSPGDGLSSEKKDVGGEDLNKGTEMNSSSKSPTVPPNDGVSSEKKDDDSITEDSKPAEMGSSKSSPTVPPGGDDLSSEKKGDVGREEFGVGDSTSMTRTPSSHSVSSSLSGGDEELNQLNLMSDNNSFKSVHLATTRHSSISPYLPPAPGADTHVRTASCSHLPSQHTMSPDPSPLTFISAGDGVCLVQPGAGAVKARVMNIEERNRDRDERSVSSDELHVSVRRQSLQFHQSTSSEAALPEPSVSSPEVRDVMKFLVSTQRRPSSDIIHEHHSPNSAHQRRETTPPAFLSAWSKLVDEIPTMPVQDLKKKFEDSDAASVSSSVGSSASTNRPPRQVRHKTRSFNLRRSQSLRDVESPGKSRYKVKGSKGNGKKLDTDRAGSPCSQD